MNHVTLYKRSVATLAGLCAVGIIAGGSALAASSGGSSGGGGGSDEVQCNDGWVYDKQKRVCVRENAANDDDLYSQGRALAAAGEYTRALRLLEAIDDKNDAMVLTMIGYSNRKMGNIDVGIDFYHQALEIEPDNVLTREYLGEGYVSMGRFDLAQAELDRIGTICGTDCDAYQDLAAAIAGDPDW